MKPDSVAFGMIPLCFLECAGVPCSSFVSFHTQSTAILFFDGTIYMIFYTHTHNNKEQKH